MPRTPNTHGGGARTNVNGLHFERTTSLDDALKNAGYQVENFVVYKDDMEIGRSVPQHNLYGHFLVPNNINYLDYNSKKWCPDDAFINFRNNIAYIIEKKFQSTPGSVDEKLPGCHFKKLEYQKLFEPLGYEVEFVYIFNDWFSSNQYDDTRNYIERMGCHYFYNIIPLDFLGL